jgi:hypothetical protein
MGTFDLQDPVRRPAERWTSAGIAAAALLLCIAVACFFTLPNILPSATDLATGALTRAF